jgi:Zn-dependent M28 family amino/carboxypeptidase
MNKTMVAILIGIGFIALSFSTGAYHRAIPPFPGEMTESSLSDARIPFSNVAYTPTFTPSDYSSMITKAMLGNLTEEMVIGYIEDLVSFGPRVTGTEACDDAAVYIYQQFESMGLDVRYQNWSSSSSLYGANIEATLKGMDKTSDDIFIICGHYDTVPTSPGADDNGAGTTAVLAAAYLMRSHTFNHTIRFVCFSGEEQGLYGSKYYAMESSKNNDSIIGVLNADMMGYADDVESRSHVRVYDDEDASTWLTDYTSDVSDQYRTYIGLTIIPSGYTWGSDHYRFWEVGYQAIFYFESKFNPYYHSAEDTIETMDPDYASRVSKLILATLANLAEPVDIQCPEVPQILSGNHQGKPDTVYAYRVVTTDPQDDDIFYLVDWDDGTETTWIGPYASRETITISKTWDSKGVYKITVKAKDALGHESDWSDSYPVRMPYLLGNDLFFPKVMDRLMSFPFFSSIFK